MLKPPTIQEAVAAFKHGISTDSVRCGVYATFVRINEDWGVKGYTNLRKAKSAYLLQDRACNIGCAPELHGPLFLIKHAGTEFYCFITEAIVETAADALGADDEFYVRGHTMGSGVFWPSHEDWYEVENTLWDDQEYRNLVSRIRHAKIGIGTADLHSRNVGYTRDGRLVAIDVGCWTEDSENCDLEVVTT